MSTPEDSDLTQPVTRPAGVPQPDPDRDRQSTLDAAATPGNTGVDDGPNPTVAEPGGDPTLGERADPTLRSHGPR